MATPARGQGQQQAHWDDEHSNACVVTFERAQRARLHGELVDARASLPECLAESCPARVRDDCTRMRVELDSAIPTAAFAVRDAAGNDLDATLTLDGARVELDAGRAMAINPGPHVVTYALPGEAPRTMKIRIYEGEKSRLIVIRAGAGVSSTKAPGDVAESNRHTAWPYVIGGAGVLLGAAGLYFLVRANGYSDDARDASKSVPAGVGPCQDFAGMPANPRFCEASDNHKTAAGLAIATGAAGAVALGSAVLIWYLESRSRGASQRAARIVPAIGPTTAGASVDVRF